jgi:ribokinase
MCVDLLLMGNVRPRFRQVEQIIADYVVELGGSANIFASQFVKLGGTAGVLGRVGEDAFGDFVRERLRGLGVDDSRVRRDPKLKTGLGVALSEPDDRAILTYPGTIDSVEPADLDSGLLSACRHWHIASYFLLSKLRRRWPRWLTACKEAGLTTSLDPNWDPDDRWDGVGELLPLVDVFLPNEAEALAIAGEASVQRAGEKLSKQGPLVVIKRGREGAIAFKDAEYWTVAPEVSGASPLVDAIGAGDNFDAGFLRAWLLRCDIPSCLSLACRCAVASLAAAGGIQGQYREGIS